MTMIKTASDLYSQGYPLPCPVLRTSDLLLHQMLATTPRLSAVSNPTIPVADTAEAVDNPERESM